MLLLLPFLLLCSKCFITPHFMRTLDDQKKSSCNPQMDRKQKRIPTAHLMSPLLLLLLLHSLILITHAVPHRPPVHCDSVGCNVSNAYGRWADPSPCRASTVVYPRTEEEIRQAVATATQKNMKVKVVTGFGHSIPKLTCPGSPPENSMLISTAEYSSSVEVDPANLRVTADSGVGIRDLIDRVEESGLSLVAATYWEGVSLGGAVSTGSHGSSWWGKGGALQEHVVGFSLVIAAGPSDGYARIIRIDGRDPLFDAVRVSLGVLGVISKVVHLPSCYKHLAHLFIFKKNKDAIHTRVHHSMS